MTLTEIIIKARIEDPTLGSTLFYRNCWRALEASIRENFNVIPNDLHALPNLWVRVDEKGEIWYLYEFAETYEEDIFTPDIEEFVDANDWEMEQPSHLQL